MGRIVTKCNRCGKIGMSHDDGDMIHKANNCYGKLIECNMSCEDLDIISRVVNENDFFQAMMDLKEKDIIEYGVKMSQFRAQVAQQKAARKAKSSTVPKCPHCSSTNIKPISGLGRGASIAMWGVFSKKINKSFECKNCGYTW